MPGPRADLRGAVYRGDGPAVVALLVDSGRRPVHGLQLAGDGLLTALAVSVEGAMPLARRCVEELRGRGREGDDERATALSAWLGDAPMPLLRPLVVDLEELASALEGESAYGGGRLDLRTGEVWPEMALDDLEDDDDEQADRLASAITGRGAFRRFKDVIARWPDLAERWSAFAEDRTRGRTRAWLADKGYTPAPPTPHS